MNFDIEDLYRDLKNGLNHERLKEISSDIIAKYKRRDNYGLSWYASLLNIQSSELSTNKLFSKIIQVYHPDKLSRILREIDSHYTNHDVEELFRLKNIYLFSEGERVKIPDFMYDSNELYGYNEKEFGYSEKDIYEEEVLSEDFSEIIDDEITDKEYGFIEAVNKAFFGNLTYTINSHELRNLEGELDLSDYDIIDLKGIENCININSLNLSVNKIYRINQLSGLTRLEYLYIAENDIEDIDGLRDLKNLRELDISFNEVEDISVLRELINLEYVNLIGNPVKDVNIIDELVKRAVIVIY